MYEYRRLSPSARREVVENRLGRGYPPHQPPHPIRIAGVYLLTAACFEHQKLMASAERRDTLLSMLFEQCRVCDVTLHAWVVLPNHYHLLADVPAFDALGQLFQQVHGRTSHDWNQEDLTAGRKVWYRYTDRLMRSEANYYASLNYIHINPVKHGCAETPYDWGHSSVHWYAEDEGREWLRNTWAKYPVRQMGAGWDD